MTAFRAAIFDVDGVLVDSPHEAAWRESLRELMEGPWQDVRAATTWSPDGFTAAVYQQHVSGKPRRAGAEAALEHFGVPDVARRAAEYGEHKQAMIERLIDEGRFAAYPDALRFVAAVDAAGLRLAAASSSKNAALLLRRIGILDRFEVDVSGRDFAHGKPHPEMFLTAARELGVDPAESVVVEDATSGVQAARAGGMAALGIARSDDADLLAAAGADLVVGSLDDVDTAALPEGRLTRTDRPPKETA